MLIEFLQSYQSGILLAFSGIEGERLRTRWVSSAEAPELVEELETFIKVLQELGPSPLRRDAAGKDAA